MQHTTHRGLRWATLPKLCQRRQKLSSNVRITDQQFISYRNRTVVAQVSPADGEEDRKTHENDDKYAYAKEGLEAGVKVIPIFPLQLVAMPYQQIPLHIFEPRYRVLFSTLLSGEKDIDEGLIQLESPFLGTKRFGLCYVSGVGQVAGVGTYLEVTKHQVTEQGTIFCLQKGLQRFRIRSVQKERPIMLAEVDFLPEGSVAKGDEETVAKLADEVRGLVRQIITINNLLKSASMEVPSEVNGCSPLELAYWVAELLQDPTVQQQILEEDSLLERLTAEKNLLTSTASYLTAAQSIEMAFKSGSQGEKETGEGRPKEQKGGQPQDDIGSSESSGEQGGKDGKS